MQLDPTKRLEADEALNHKYFADLPPKIYELPHGSLYLKFFMVLHRQLFNEFDIILFVFSQNPAFILWMGWNNIRKIITEEVSQKQEATIFGEKYKRVENVGD